MAEQCGCFSWVISSICLQMCSHRLVSVLQGIECSSVSEGLTAEKTDCWVNICKSVDDLMCIFSVNAPRLQQLDNCFPRMLYSSKTQEGVCVCVCARAATWADFQMVPFLCRPGAVCIHSHRDIRDMRVYTFSDLHIRANNPALVFTYTPKSLRVHCSLVCFSLMCLMSLCGSL